MNQNTKDKLNNPFTEEWYKSELKEFQTDGFQEWTNKAGLTVYEFSIIEILILLFSFPVVFICSSVSFFLMVGYIGVVTSFVMGNRKIKETEPRFIAFFLWRTFNIKPFPDYYYPSEPVEKGLKRIELKYTKNENFNLDRKT
jgi:hypothetical protein